ncbi:NME/NM23 family member 8 [Homo sapiens]|uniref:NME/NM23 family member 8 n=1 Tax=Homo sapiens TaxID=9606 RepID=F8WEA2_HUMAN|nr:NME/NM23 family member 8 [Homo sapiens]KAI4013517.1 NME/NM23 family member 8 [Homo sapiens]
MASKKREVQLQAEADNIVTLQPFRDKCEPVFLFSVMMFCVLLKMKTSKYWSKDK